MSVETQPPECFGPRDREFVTQQPSPTLGVAFRRATIALPADGILLIEDNEDDAELSLRTLKKLDLPLPILWLSDSARAVEALEQTTDLPRLILLDLRMPRVDGFEVLRRLKTGETTRDITIIVMASSPRAPELPRCFALGADSFVVKPLRRDAFIAACDNALLELPFR